MSKISMASAAILCCLALPLAVAAEPGHPRGEGMGGHGMMEGGHGAGHGMPHDGHGLAAPWRASLTEDQKGEISWSHLRLRQNQSMLDARIALKEAEIDLIVTGEETGEEALQAAVEELTALEKEKALNHYRHMMEVRQLLTPQQRVSFDLGVLSRKGGGHR